MTLKFISLPLAVVAFGFINAHAFAKVSYADALESNRAHREQWESVNIPPDTKGITPAEMPEDGANADLGKWVKVSSTLTDVVNAGSYSNLLSPNSEGGACFRGTKGLILATERECTNWNSGGWHCEGYGTETVSNKGYKATCK